MPNTLNVKPEALAPPRSSRREVASDAHVLWLPQGYQRPLQLEDVFDLAPDDRVQAISKDFERHWQAELPKKESGGKPSLVRDLGLGQAAWI